MDEEDSQDELINRNASHGKGKRPATSILSEEEENSEDGEDSQAGATDSEDVEDDDDASLDGEEEEEEEDSEHEDAEKDLEGAVGGTSADLAGLSSDEDAERCPICLNSFHEQPVATPESCKHYFCLDCILEWAKNANSCPVDRIVFGNILLRKCYGGKVQKTITVQKTVKAGQEEQIDLDLEQTNCEVCGGSDREDRLLLCDGCDAGYHMECLTPPLDAVPVEEWFCPECAANNHNTRSERSSEDETSVFPTTSSSRPSNSRPTRAIARTQHSERVRANVNRHRITQARTAAQIAPRYLMQSTWLDETINAVVAGLNTAVYIRNLTPRARRRRRKTVKRRKPKKEGKAVEGKTSSTKVRRRKRKARRTKSRRKLVVKKDTTTRSRIARSLGIRKPVRSSSVPSVYRPSEQTLGSMRADIGAASLSIYGDPFDLDPFDNEEEEMEQASAPSSLLEAKQRGLSRSAMRSHQPVARPISAGLPRRGHSIPQVEEVAEAAPVPDLLGSILSGQSMLLMDSSDVVINRDGSLKAIKPLSLSLPRRSTSGSSTSGETVSTPSTGASLFQSNRQPTLSSSSSSSSPLNRQSSSHSFPHPCPSPVTPVSPSPPTSHMPSSIIGHPRLHTPLPHRSMPSQPAGTERNQGGTCGVRGQPPTTVTSGASDSRHGDRGTPPQQPPAKKPTPKPVWVDVSGLPRIPKIKRESHSAVHSSSRSNSNNLPESSMTSLAGDRGRQHTIDQKGTSASRQSRAVERQRLDRSGPSSSFSNSFSAPSSSASLTSNPRPSSSSAISFRISASGNPWHTRRLSGPESTMLPKDKEKAKRAQKDKQMLLSSLSKSKKASVKSEVYDPFNPTGSDSSESEDENDSPEMGAQSMTMEQNEGSEHLIKTEPMDLDPPTEESSAMCVQVKKEPTSVKDEPWLLPSRHSAPEHTQMQSGSLAAVMAYSESPVVSDAERSETLESPFTKPLDRSRSSSTSSHYSDTKVEVKSEPEDEPSLVESEVPKGNGLYDEVPSLASSSDASHKNKDKEMSPCPQLKEERRQSESASLSPSSKEFENTRKKKNQLPSEERRDSHSISPDHRRSRSKSKEKTHSRSRSKEKGRSRSRSIERGHSSSTSKGKRRSRSRSKERRRSRSRSKERRRSRSRSKERRRSRSRSKERRRSRSRSKERRRSRSRSKERRQSRSRSKERKRSRSRSKERKRSRSRSKERKRSRSRSKERRRSRSRSKERRRSRSRSKERKRSRSRSKERRRSRSRSKDRRRSRSRSKDRRRSRSRSKDRRRSCSRSKDRRRSRSRSKGRRRSRSRSKEQRRSRSRSKERRYSRSQDRRPLTRSSSLESSKKRKTKQEGHEQHDGRGKDGHKKSKEKKRSHSRSRSRSRERRREQPSSHRSSSVSRDGNEARLKRKRSRSTSRERKRRTVPEGTRQKERSTNKYTASISVKAKEPNHSLNKNSLVLKEEPRTNECETKISFVSIKEAEPSKDSLLTEGLKKPEEIKMETYLFSMEDKPHEATPKEMKQENTWSLGEVKDSQLQKDIKREKEESYSLCEGLKPEEIKKEEITTLSVIQKSESEELNHIFSKTPESQTSSQDERSTSNILELPKPVKIEQPDEEYGDEEYGDDDGDDPFSESALIINLCPSDPDPMDCEKEPEGESKSLSVVTKEETEFECYQEACPMKQEPLDSSDEDINVDYLIDNLDFIKKEMKDSPVTDPADAVEPQPVIQEVSTGAKQEIESALVMTSTKTKSQGKRVTWNIQEPEGPQPEKMSKLALFKLKLKQEGPRKTALTSSSQSPGQEAAPIQVGPKLAATNINSPAQEELFEGGSKPCTEELLQDPHQKDMLCTNTYMKKLHMQERAIEEVKLAIKPFYQKRDITKEEYKEILRKAVQKVCHSKSGEINPVKVANLVKAYVDKYKHARKHRKVGSLGPSQIAEGPKDSETPL